MRNSGNRRDRSVGPRERSLPAFSPPEGAGEAFSLLAAPTGQQGARSGHLSVAARTEGREFSPEDEETLVMFASQAALVIANARRYRDEQRARADLETLVDTSPVGVVVFDARTGNRPRAFVYQQLLATSGPSKPV